MIIKDGNWLNYGIAFLIQCEIAHFLLGFVVGALAYWLISTILYKWYLIQETDRFIFIVLLLLSLSLSVVVHVSQDYVLNLF
jgi:NhaP-type Na+/H+ or K+/H+ antiporter